MRLQLNSTVWMLFGVSTLLWLGSFLLAGSRRERSTLKWRVVPLSLFGFAWVAFSADFLFRFLALAYDPALFRASLYPLWRLPEGALGRTWLYIAVYWLLFCLGMVFATRIMRVRVPKFLGRLNLVEDRANLRALDVLAVGTMIAVLAVSVVRLPSGLATPLGHFGSLWVVPATMSWFLHFRGRRVGIRRFLYLAPGIVAFLLSPYREHLVVLFLCVFLPLLMGRRRVGLPVAVGVMFAVLLASSIALYVYRPFKWEGEKWEVTRGYIDWQLWRERPQQAPWSKLSVRFHGFDAAALTLYLVPAVFPYQDRNIGWELLVSALVPRAIHGGKVHVQRGRLFSTTIWAFDEQGRTIRRHSAMIAPSMVGDLWTAGGLKMIAFGAFIWGGLIGLLECWRRSLRPGPAVALVVLLGIRVAGGIERDFVHASSTIIQLIIVLLLVLAFLPFRRTSYRSKPIGGRQKGGTVFMPQKRETD